MMDTECLLCGDRLAPITSTIGFLRAPLGEVAEALHDWRTEIHGSATASRQVGGLLANVGRLEPLTGGVRPRELLVATQDPRWTALFDCGVQGGDQVMTVGYLARRAAWEGVVVTAIPDRPATVSGPGTHGALQLEMFGPSDTDFLNYVRTISIVRDGARWRFDANGIVQAFEQVEAYSKRKVTERFTLPMLTSYAEALGLGPFVQDFYQGPSVVVASPCVVPVGGLTLSLSEARRRAGVV